MPDCTLCKGRGWIVRVGPTFGCSKPNRVVGCPACAGETGGWVSDLDAPGKLDVALARRMGAAVYMWCGVQKPLPSPSDPHEDEP